jgi:hypothetical protein
MDYEVEIVLRLVEKNGKNLQQAGDTPPSDANR